MSTVPLSHPGAASQAPPVDTVRARSQTAPTVLGVTLLLMLLYAAFSHGAAALATEARIQVAIAVIVAVAGAAWLWSGTLMLRASRTAVAGVALFGAFALWSGITVLWSVAPDQTWIELNRALTYVLVLGLSIVIGSSMRRAYALIANGFLLVALAVTAYALGQKLLPGLHISGVFDLNQTGPLPRLQEPLGYWNALALFISFGVPVALAQAVDLRRTRRARVGALVSVQMILLTIGLTYSRGGLIALVAGLAAGIAISGARLRSMMWLGAATVAAIPPLVFGLTNNSLSSPNVSLASREGAGAILLAVLAISSGALILGARRLHESEGRSHIGAERARRIARLLLGLAAVAVIAGLLAVTLSSRGFTGTFSHAWSSFTTTRVTSTYDPQRLLSANSENRWVWWKEAAGAFSARPVAGWGAGSFRVVHLLYRRDRLSVDQPHSVPLQFLSETGLIGFGLAIAAAGLLLTAATRRVRRQPLGPERLVTASLLAGVVIFLVHSLYDWDWDIPAVTLPALVFLGVLIGCPGRSPALRTGPALRGIGLAAMTLCACTFALSAALPSLAASKASHAVVEAAGSPAAAQHADATAELASRLDPLSDAGLLVEATIALRSRQFRQARSLLLSAVKREPSDITAWRQLALVELGVGDARSSALAAKRVAELDPIGTTPPATGTRPRSGAVSPTPPPSSATAQPLRSR